MSTLNIQIRPVTPPEVPAISALAREIWQATYPGIITQEQIDFMLEQRYGHERLYVMDGALIPGALVANPALTVAALAERNIENILQRDV